MLPATNRAADGGGQAVRPLPASPVQLLPAALQVDTCTVFEVRCACVGTTVQLLECRQCTCDVHVSLLCGADLRGVQCMMCARVCTVFGNQTTGNGISASLCLRMPLKRMEPGSMERQPFGQLPTSTCVWCGGDCSLRPLRLLAAVARLLLLWWWLCIARHACCQVWCRLRARLGRGACGLPR